MTDHIASAETEISAPRTSVWDALTDPEQISVYMFGSTVESEWTPGSTITWSGEYEGKPYEDKGKIIDIEPEQKLTMTHFSPLGGQDDVPENYHTLTYDLEEADGHTRVRLTQDNNASAEEAEHSTSNWQTMLDGLKEFVESR